MITDAQKAQRAKGVGSSDVPVILGLSRFKTAYDLWLERMGRVDPQPENEAMAIGSQIEPLLLSMAAQRIGDRVVRPSQTFVGGKAHHRANIDGMVGIAKRGHPIVEAKSTGWLEGWGADGTDEVPEGVRAQVMYQMAIASSTTAYVACLRAERGLQFSLHPIRYDESLAVAILGAVDDWWDYVVRGTAPSSSQPSLDCVKRMRYEEDASPVIIDAGLLVEDIVAREKAQQAEAFADACRARVLAALGSARSGQSEDGRYTVKVSSVKTDRFDAKAFQQGHPDLAAQYRIESGYNRVTVKAVKKGKGE